MGLWFLPVKAQTPSPFSTAKLNYNNDTGMVIYHSEMTHGKNRKNFSIFSAEEFIAAITQHIPDR